MATNQEHIHVGQQHLFPELERFEVQTLADAKRILLRASLGWSKDSWTAETYYHWSIGGIPIASGRNCYRAGPEIEEIVTFCQDGEVIARFKNKEAQDLFECYAEKHRIPD